MVTRELKSQMFHQKRVVYNYFLTSYRREKFLNIQDKLDTKNQSRIRVNTFYSKVVKSHTESIREIKRFSCY